MSPDELQTAGNSIGLIFLGGVAAWKAHRADLQSRPTGNGFADEVRDGITELRREVQDGFRDGRRRMDRIETKIDGHLGDHVRAALKRDEG